MHLARNILHVLVHVLLYLLSQVNAFLVRAFPSRNWVFVHGLPYICYFIVFALMVTNIVCTQLSFIGLKRFLG